MTLASIIEKETGRPEERPLVAAVFLNRLRAGMPLQTDPTVIYGADRAASGTLGRELTRADLELDNPYNTYRHRACRPGRSPIPGRRLDRGGGAGCVIDYLYFVANGNGGHAFAATLGEHNRNVARWRKLRNRCRLSRPHSLPGQRAVAKRCRPAGSSPASRAPR